jgi:hypothetical protein
MVFIGAWDVWIPWGDADFWCRGQTWKIVSEKTEHDTVSRVSGLQSISKWLLYPIFYRPGGVFLTAKSIRLIVRRNRGGRQIH